MPFCKKLFKKLNTLFFILLGITSTLYANDSLLIELSKSKVAVDSGSIVVTFTNRSDKPLRVLKWNTPLEDELSSNIFRITTNHKNIGYQGRVVKRGQPQDDDYTIFDVGESRSVIVNLPTYYKMFQKGNYTIAYKGDFLYLSETQKLKKLKKSKKSDITISYIPSLDNRAKREKVTAQFNGCSQRGIDVLDETHNKSLDLAKVASEAMNSTPNLTKAQRYVTWFGVATNQRQQEVNSTFSKIYDALDNKKISYDCSTCTENNVFAYVYPDEPYTIYLCGSFWSAELTGTDSKAGTLIHELTHFMVIGQTDDYVYGQADAKELAKIAPEKAIKNADNYEFFAEDTPHLSMEEVEEGSKFDNAPQLSEFPFTDTIRSVGDTNIYKLIPSKDENYSIYSTGNLDTYGILYDKNGTLLTQQDDISISNYNFEVSCNFIKSKIYYLEVGAYKTDIGKYTLNLKDREFPIQNSTDNNSSDLNSSERDNNESNGTTNRQSNSNESSSHTTKEIPTLNYIGLLILMILTSFVAYRESKKTI